MRRRPNTCSLAISLFITAVVCAGCGERTGAAKDGEGLSELLRRAGAEDIVFAGAHKDVLLYGWGPIRVWFRERVGEGDDSVTTAPEGRHCSAIYVLDQERLLKAIPSDTPVQPYRPCVYEMDDERIALVSYVFVERQRYWEVYQSEDSEFPYMCQVHLVSPGHCEKVFEQEFSFLRHTNANAPIISYFLPMKDIQARFHLLLLDHTLGTPAEKFRYVGGRVRNAFRWREAEQRFEPIGISPMNKQQGDASRSQ